MTTSDKTKHNKIVQRKRKCSIGSDASGRINTYLVNFSDNALKM